MVENDNEVVQDLIRDILKIAPRLRPDQMLKIARLCGFKCGAARFRENYNTIIGRIL